VSSSHHCIVAKVGDGGGKVISLVLVEELNDGIDLDKVDCEFADEIKLFELLQDFVLPRARCKLGYDWLE
jgi:hypothetical protein